jgi:glycosyltransferase involved in cell wall biosynthesis
MTSFADTKISVVVNGRFHAFDYAAELSKKHQLHLLISTMPFSVAKRFGINKKNYVGLPIFEVIKKLYRKILRREPPTLLYAKAFTKIASFFVPKDSDIVISFAGYSQEIFESKKLINTIKILDRGSTHTLENIYLNKIAANYHKTKWEPHSKIFIERELKEYELADKILIPSTFVKKTFLKNDIPEEKLIQIPYAYSLAKFNGLKINKEKKEKAVLFVGQISPRKGILVLINAMKLVIEKLPDVKLWLVGPKNSPIPDSFFEESWINNFGILSGQELFDKYNQASVFCLPSFEEGLALVLTEALNCALPIVATENSGAGNLIKEGIQGFIVPAGDHIKTAEMIIEVLENPEKYSFLESNKITNSNMTWAKYCEALINKIQDI